MNNSNSQDHQHSLQHKIALLDQEWELEKERYKINVEHGKAQVTSVVQAGLLGILTVVASGAFVYFTAGNGVGEDGGSILTQWFPLIFMLLVVASAIYTISKAAAYEKGEKRYLEKRKRLLDKVK